MHIVIALATRDRPQMLRECVDSLFAQVLPESVKPSIVIVENSEQSKRRPLCEELARIAPAPWSVTYVHEPKLGIPIARNRSLEVALELAPDWIAFIDDDETAEPSWLANMVEASTLHNADVFQGPVDYRFGADAPGWLPRKVSRRRPTGTRLETAFTNNVMMRAEIARCGLRFDESMRFTGGSDSDFFFRAAEKGWILRWANDAVVREVVQPSRLTMSWQLERALRVAANATASHVKRKGLGSALARHVPRGLRRAIRGVIVAVFGAILFPFSRTRGLRAVCSGLCDICSGAGGIGAFFRVSPQPYKQVDGM